MTSRSDAALLALPDCFRYSEGIALVGERTLRSMTTNGQIDQVARGLYRKRDLFGDDDLLEITMRSPQATLCLQTALVRHNLIDDIPRCIDVAIPRGAWSPTTRAPVQWRHFDSQTFEIGREEIEVVGGSISLYSAERSIVDAFRLRHLVGYETATDALKTWLNSGGQPSTLLHIAQTFPRTLNTVRTTLEILL